MEVLSGPQLVVAALTLSDWSGPQLPGAGPVVDKGT